MNKAIAGFFILLLSLTLTSCKERTCLEGHKEPRVGMMLAGKILVPYNYQAFICDVYEKENNDNTNF